MRSNRWIIAIATLLLLPAAQLAAQEEPAAGRRAAGQVDRNADDRAADRSSNSDRTIAECLAISNQEEIALAKLAASRSENPKVKQLAEMMIKDHQKSLAALQAFGGEDVALRAQSDAAPQRTARREPGAARPGREPQDPTQRTAAREVEGLNFLDVKRQIAEKCIQSAEKQWSEHRGAEGDKCFVGQQVVLHQQMIDAQEVLKQYASPEFQTVIDKSISTTQMHLTHAKDLLKELDSARGTQPAATN
jgi:predicted outer membrane protein